MLVAQKSDAPQLAHLPSSFQPIFYHRSDTDRLEHLFLPLFLSRLPTGSVHFPMNRVPLLLMRRYVVTVHDMSTLLFSDRLQRLDRRAPVPVPPRFAARLESHNSFRRHRRDVQQRSRNSRRIASRLSTTPRRPSSSIATVPQSLFSLPVLKPPRPSAREFWNATRFNYPFLLYAGNIRPQKNIPRLVEAFAVARAELKMHPRYRNLRLIIIGDEISKYPAVRRAVMQSRVEHSVRFLGFVPFETLRVFYELAAAFVFPSLYEGFGLPPLEAMASGTPVITSEIGALPEVVGDAAMLVNPENVFDIARGIREVLLNDDLRASLIEKGRRHAATFSWERTAQEVIGIYRQVCDQPKGYKSDSKTDAR